MSRIGQNHLPASPADFMKKCSDKQRFVLSPLFTVARATEHFARQQSNEAYFSLGDLLARTKRHILKRKCQAIFRNSHTCKKCETFIRKYAYGQDYIGTINDDQEKLSVKLSQNSV